MGFLDETPARTRVLLLVEVSWSQSNCLRASGNPQGSPMAAALSAHDGIPSCGIHCYQRRERRELRNLQAMGCSA
jgi:hypothetical protein